MAWPLSRHLYRTSKKVLHNRRVFAEKASRPVFERGEIINYLFAATLYPLARAIVGWRFSEPKIPGNAIAIGSRKRAVLKAVINGEMPLDDLEYEWGDATWRFWDMRMALRYYAFIAKHLPFMIALLLRRSGWEFAHFTVCLLEYYYLHALLERHRQISTIYCGYYVDRKSLLLSRIKEETGIRCVGVQHGAFNIFPRLYRAKVDEVILMYPFSMPYAADFFDLREAENCQVDPSAFEFSWGEKQSDGRFIVFGASADSTKTNFEIIEALDLTLPDSVEVLVKLHPRDKPDAYQHLIKGRVGWIDFNAKNAAAYVGQLSSVIAEASALGVPIAVMHGAKGRGSDFQRELSEQVYNDASSLAKAARDLVSEQKR